MRSIGAKTLIIGVLALLLGACSAVRLGYDNGVTLATWWLDGHLDLNRAQKAQLQPELAQWFDWHRATQLPDYAQWLARWQARSSGNVSAAEVCEWSDVARSRLQTAADRALPAAARLLPLVTPAQWQHFERRQAERQAELRKEHLQPRSEDRLQAALARAVERAEDFYGPLEPAQRQLLAEAAAASPMEPELWLADREARQRELLRALRQAQQESDVTRRAEALRAAATQYLAPASEGRYATLQARWTRHNCDVTARLHNSSHPGQRQHLKARLAAWQEDLQALADKAAPL